jgi:hypothetical protein
MPQFSKREFFGYIVYVYPGWNDKIRKSLHKIRFDRLPYFTGADIIFTLEITPMEHAESCSELKYVWYLIPEVEKDVPITSGDGVYLNPNKDYKANIVLPHISFPNNYKLDIEVILNDKKRRQCVADFEITPRSSNEFKFIWSIWTIIIGGVGVAIGLLIQKLFG